MRDQQLQLLWTARIDYEENSGVQQHTHDEYDQILIVMEGEGVCGVGDKEFSLVPECFYFFPKHIPHHFLFSKRGVTLDYKFFLADDFRELMPSPPSHGTCPMQELTEFKYWFNLSYLNLKDPRPLLPLRIDAGFKGTLLSLFGDISHRFQPEITTDISSGSSHPQSIQHQIADYIKNHIHLDLKLKDIALKFSFHPNYLIKLFQAQFNMPPILYLQEIRLKRACEYLEFTNEPLSLIAEHIGWSYPYFSRVFHKKIGITPSKYRENARTAIGRDVILANDFINEWQIV